MITWTPTYTMSWKNPKLRALDRDGKLLFRWLCANPSISMSGIYCLSVHEAMDDLDMARPAVLATVEQVASIHLEVGRGTPLIRWDPGTGVVWVVGQWKQSVGNPSPKHKIAIGNEFLRSSSLPFWKEFFAKYIALVAFLKRANNYKRHDEFKALVDTLGGRPSTMGFQPSKDLAQLPADPATAPEPGTGAPTAATAGLTAPRQGHPLCLSPKGIAEWHQYKKERYTVGVGSPPHPTPHGDEGTAQAPAARSGGAWRPRADIAADLDESPGPQVPGQRLTNHAHTGKPLERLVEQLADERLAADLEDPPPTCVGAPCPGCRTCAAANGEIFIPLEPTTEPTITYDRGEGLPPLKTRVLVDDTLPADQVVLTDGTEAGTVVLQNVGAFNPDCIICVANHRQGTDHRPCPPKGHPLSELLHAFNLKKIDLDTYVEMVKNQEPGAFQPEAPELPFEGGTS